MHHREAELRIAVKERKVAQPVEQLISVGREQYVAEGVFPLFSDALASGEQVQIVVAEDAYGAIAEGLDVSHDLERMGAAVHEIAREPQEVALRFELDLVEQRLELRETALNVSDCVNGHRS